MSLSLNDLNDDCLRVIMENLEFTDQLALPYVCQRLQKTVAETWQHNCKELIIDENNFKKISFDSRREYFREYIRCICDNVEVLRLILTNDTQIEVLENIKFSNVNTLLVRTEFPNDIDIKKHSNQTLKIFQIIIKIFPNLTSLGLYGGITGEHLWLFENIEELNLNYCEHLETKHFKEIFSKLKKLKRLSIFCYAASYFKDYNSDITFCKSLEEIYINHRDLIFINEALFKLENLRKIVCCLMADISHLLELIVNKYGNVMHTMVFERSFESNSKICKLVQKMVSLRCLIIDNDAITNDQLRNIAASLGNTLEEFYYRKKPTKKIVTNYEGDGLLDLVRQCTNLKILDLTGVDIDKKFIEKVAKIIAFDGEKRNQTLVMHCSKTKITHDDLQILDLPAKLRITFKYNELDLQGKRSFHCEWNTQSDETH